jgi:hypothetical protein
MRWFQYRLRTLLVVIFLASVWLGWDRYQQGTIVRRIKAAGGSVVRSHSIGWIEHGPVVEVVIPWSERKAISLDDLERFSALTRLTFRDVRSAPGVAPTVRFDNMTMYAAYGRDALSDVWDAGVNLHGDVTFEFK